MPAAETVAPPDPKVKPEDQPKDSSRLNNPQLDSKGKPTVKAVTTADQAWQICKGLKKEAEENRIPMNATIYAKHGGEAPFNSMLLKRANQGYRNNFTHFFLSGITDRTEPQFRDAINRVEYLTYSKLPDDWPDASRKNKLFRKHLSDTIRADPCWSDFVADSIGENTLIGYATPAWLDSSEVEWRPTLYRSDQIFFPKGTKQNSKGVPYFAVEEYLMVHEFIERFGEDKAEEAGYNIKNCVYIVNKAQGKSEETELDKVDNIREGAYANNYGAGGTAKTIRLYHLVVQEYDGTVELWTVDGNEGRELRHVEELHPSIEEATMLFTLQRGNGKLYGSKGQGRQLVNIHIAAERTFCMALDMFTWSGMPIFQAPTKDLNKMKPVHVHPFMVVDETFKPTKLTIQFKPTEFLAIRGALRETAEDIAGAFIPPQIVREQTPSTKIADAERAAARQKISQGVLGRNFKQWGECIGIMQRKICSPIVIREAVKVQEERKKKEKEGIRVVAKQIFDWIKKAVGSGTNDQKNPVESAYESKIADREAVECVVKMLNDGLTPEEIAYLANQPATDAGLLSATDDADRATLDFIAANQQIQNPRINKDEATWIAGEAMKVPQDRLHRLIIDEEMDQTIKAEAVWKQTVENGEFFDGTMMPVSPRDNHAIHREVMAKPMGTLAKALQAAPTPQLAGTADLMRQHYAAHVQADLELQDNKQQLQIETKMIQDFGKIITTAQKAMEEQQLANGGISPENLPVPNGPNGNGMPPPEVLSALTDTAELAVRNREADLHEQELKLQAQQHAANMRTNAEKNDQDLMKSGLEVAKIQLEAQRMAEQPNPKQ